MKKLFAIISILISVILLYLVLRPSNFQELEMLKKDYASKTSAFFKFNNYEYHYTQKGEGVPLIFIHGVGLDHQMWEYQIYSFENTILTYDILGHGKTPLEKKKYNF